MSERVERLAKPSRGHKQEQIRTIVSEMVSGQRERADLWRHRAKNERNSLQKNAALGAAQSYDLLAEIWEDMVAIMDEILEENTHLRQRIEEMESREISSQNNYGFREKLPPLLQNPRERKEWEIPPDILGDI